MLRLMRQLMSRMGLTGAVVLALAFATPAFASHACATEACAPAGRTSIDAPAEAGEACPDCGPACANGCCHAQHAATAPDLSVPAAQLMNRPAPEPAHAEEGHEEGAAETPLVALSPDDATAAGVTVVALQRGGQVIRVSDVATVEIGRAPRLGSASADGRETVVGAALMLQGENSREVAHRVGQRLEEIQSSLPPGVALRPELDRTDLVEATIKTVEHNLALGALLVIAVLFFALGNMRAAVITALVIENTLRPLGIARHEQGRPLTVAERLSIAAASKHWPNPGEPKAAVVERMEQNLSTLLGNNYEFTQPIEMRFNELIAGVRRSDVAVMIYGDDFAAMSRTAAEVAGVLNGIEGAADVRVEQVSGQPTITATVDRTAAAAQWVHASDAADALAGRSAGQVNEGDRRFDVVVRLGDPFRDDPAIMEQLPVMPENAEAGAPTVPSWTGNAKRDQPRPR
ncbi:efflux RND transporter permease subunit [Brevundimonas staleyi]|uniref:Efflux RND transporter permease subunit n=1 Tax=Brevundimonas staleyi TaxID=74326 RepID=A0ABW0FKT2_9CAUL